MITLTCTCGKIVEVGDDLAGREAKCPACGALVAVPGKEPATAPGRPVPPPPAAPPRPAIPYAPFPPVRRPADRAAIILGVVCGAAMLLTFFIPWGVRSSSEAYYSRGGWSGEGRGATIVMSWDLLSRNAGVMAVSFIALWLLGAAAVVVSATVRGRALLVVQGALGLAALVVVPSWGTFWFILFRSYPWWAQAALGGFAALSLVCLVAGSHLCLRYPRVAAPVFLAGTSGGVLAILQLGTVISLIVALTRVGRYEEPSFGAIVAVVGLVASLVLLTAGVLSAVNVRNWRGHARGLAVVSLGLAYGGFGLRALTQLLWHILVGEGIGFFLGSFNMWLFFVAPLVLLAGALGMLVRGVLSQGGPAPVPVRPPVPVPLPARPPAAGVPEQLRLLKNLLDQGLISEGDHARKRKDLIDTL